MTDLKSVGIKDLKNNLSAYLREVHRGTRILVLDRRTVVAELHEPGATYAAPGAADPVLSGWIQSGIVLPPIREKEALPSSPVVLEEGAAQRLLDEDRAEGGR